jgi:hypothetical protein
MSRTRFDESLSDIDARLVAEAEADLDRLLAVEPSAEFVARVRVAISNHKVERNWAAWIKVALAAAAIVVVAAAIALRQDNPAVDGSLVVAPRMPDTVLAAPLAVVPPVTTSTQVGRVRLRPVRQVVEPEIVIDGSLGEAIRRLAAQTRGKVADPEAFEVAAPSPSASQLSVPSVILDPLNVPELVLTPADSALRGDAGSTEHQKE